MASSSVDGEDNGREQEIRLVRSGELWVATDVETGVASQGESREVALENLDEALALHRGEIGDSVDSPEAEREVLRKLDIDPDEVEQAREDAGELPEFMQ
ncbi:type II toxin-antitoxin system HicB family antitoxin [Natronomonas sp. LN261]|uniref:type II toxin-antitoxin system HicB family antitoxin n=1 Tax=Natronomonas sp. LN261 TaxID=2750669 RepID=UPI0015EEAE3E|nr:type II toxin-antitoxin system HicB family antitoxin [Natronomonas sp. LN261]